ncbi:cyclic-phosphate processing receiver domain-containing protein [Solibacillus sp. FSL K6-1126]|uniref:cyclic-phosphate processing receiver domain-containing protein n=1 Tax=Solibacillus sp. FSL K6-1126 TaxID=2921463 RepID=UPI0030F63ACC
METQKINLYVDDLRDCPNGFVVARTFQEAIHLIENHEVEILSLDHDLGEDLHGNLLPTGYDLVKYICEKGLRANKIYIHTDNPVGRENMYQTLHGAKRRGFIDSDIEIYHYPITENKYTE